MHTNHSGWGVTGARYFPQIAEFIARRSARTVLDYGCGKGRLLDDLRGTYPEIIVDGYDPGVPRFNWLPRTQYDVALCIDVLEHVEPEHIKGVIQHLAQIATWVYAVVSTAPAHKLLPDGRNAHLIVEPYHWWKEILPEHRLVGTAVDYFEIEW